MRWSPLLAAALFACGVSDTQLDTDADSQVVVDDETVFPDTDSDGYHDDVDAFPADPAEHSDLDGDGVGDNADAFPADAQSSVDADEDGYGNGRDCDDNNAAVNPSALEVPYNGLDDDCTALTPDDDLDADGVMASADCDDADADVTITLLAYVDSDDDGFGVGSAQDLCEATIPAGYSSLDGDCDDLDGSVNPGVVEVPYDGIDNDCLDGDTWDDDGDGYTAIGSPTGSADDCADTNSNIHPDAEDVPGDAIDDDCSGDAFDADADGTNDRNGGDCDDADASVGPHMAELYNNGIDDDCDDTTLDDVADADGDGFDAVSAGGLDCDDGDAAVHPDARELPDDGIDNDCADGDLVAADGVGVYINNGTLFCDDTAGTLNAPACSLDILADLADDAHVFIAGGPYASASVVSDISVYGGYDGAWQPTDERTEIAVQPDQPALVVQDAELFASGLLLNGDDEGELVAMTATGSVVALSDSAIVVTSRGNIVRAVTSSQSDLSLDGVAVQTTGYFDAIGVRTTESNVTVVDSELATWCWSGEAHTVWSEDDQTVSLDNSLLQASGYNGVGIALFADALDQLTVTDSLLEVPYTASAGSAVQLNPFHGSGDIRDSELVVEHAENVANIYVSGSGVLDLDNSTVLSGSSEGVIWGLYVSGAAVALTDVVVDGGLAIGEDGTGVYMSGNASNVSITDSVVVAPGSYGGDSVAVNGSGTLTVRDSEMLGGSAAGESIGLRSGSGDTTLVNTVAVGASGTHALGADVAGGAFTGAHSVFRGGIASDAAYGIRLDKEATGLVYNSVLVTGYGSSVSAGLAYESDPTSGTVLRNNAIWIESPDGYAGYADEREESTVSWLDIDTGVDASGSFAVDDVFLDSVNNDFHAAPGAVQLAEAGIDPASLNLSVDYLDVSDDLDLDADGDVRVGWDVGLDEVDGVFE